MDNFLIVVDDLEAVKAFFPEPGFELQGETTVGAPRWIVSIDEPLARLLAHGAELIGKWCNTGIRTGSPYLRGPECIIVGLAVELR